MGGTTVSSALYTPRGSAGCTSCSKNCDKTCYIIMGCAFGGTFGLLFIALITIYFCCRRKPSKVLQPVSIMLVKPQLQKQSLDRLETEIGGFLDKNPHILDMSDYKIPAYLKEQISGLSDNDASMALELVAKRRVSLV